jgi:hypothetical protein
MVHVYKIAMHGAKPDTPNKPQTWYRLAAKLLHNGIKVGEIMPRTTAFQ